MAKLKLSDSSPTKTSSKLICSNKDDDNNKHQKHSIVPWSSPDGCSSPSFNGNQASLLTSCCSHSNNNNPQHHQDISKSGSRLVVTFFKMIRYTIVVSCVIFLARLVASNWLNHGINYGLCKFRECCHEDDGTGYIRYGNGAELLLHQLNVKVHGQPLIISPIYKSIKAHLKEDKPMRPLVMYFSGWTGTGKTYVAKLIANNLYKNGMNSQFVKYISSSYHFPTKIEEHQVADQRLRLIDMIRQTISKCERSLIIFDELDKLPPGVVDALQPLVDYIEDLDGVRYNKAIFIFLSNTGAEKLNSLSYKMFRDGKERKDLSSKDIEEILIQESYNERGGLRQSSLLKRYSIGVFVPFLPLEREHVKLCIRDEIASQNLTSDSRQIELLIEEIADELMYFPDETRLYSKSGCKGVHDKVINNIDLPNTFLGKRSYSRNEL